MTAGAYQDARRVNPNLPADITQANPQQLTQAQNAYTQQNAGYLKNYGIEPTQQNLQAAHFLGAKGLSDYLKNGQISEAAAKANGGEENVRRIVNARLGGQAAPASGATQQAQPQAQPVQQPQAQPTGPAAPYDMGDFAGVNQAVAQQAAMAQPQMPQAQQDAAVQAEFQRVRDHEDLSSGDPKRLMALTEHPDKAISTAAAGQLADIFKDKKLQDYARNKVEDDLSKGKITNTDRLKGEEGSYIKAYLFNRLGLTELAKKEQELINPSKQYDSVALDGVPYTVISNPTNGQVIGAKQGDKNITDPAILEQLQANNMNLKKGVHVTKVVSKIDPKTGIEVNEQTLSDGKTRFIQGGKIYTGDVSRLTDAGDYTKTEDRKVLAADTNLRKQYPNPTDEQRYQALRKAGVGQRRIESELGAPAGSLEKAGTKLPEKTEAAATTGGKPSAGVTTGIGPKPQPPTIREPLPGESAKAYEAHQKQVKESYDSELDVWKKKQDRMEKKAEDLPAKQQAAEESLAIVDRLIKHPGFSDVIGFPNILTGIYSPPTTEARDFKALYKQVQGDQFLAAIRQMKGSGAVSNIEGDKATAAISAIQDPYISEAEFKRNVKIYQDVIKRGIDSQRREVGLDPIYPDVAPANAGNKPAGGGSQEGQTGTSKSGKPIIYRNGRWEYQ